jgi:hypothetical protein
MKYKITAILILVMFLMTGSVLSQDKEKNLKDKLKDIEGEVEKVIIETDKGRVVFEGDEADRLIKRMKRNELVYGIHPKDFKNFSNMNLDSLIKYSRSMIDSGLVFRSYFRDSIKHNIDSMMFFLRRDMDSLKISIGRTDIDSILKSLPKFNDSLFASRFHNRNFNFKFFSSPEGEERVIIIFPREDMEDDELDIIIRGDAFKQGETKKIIIDEEGGEKKVTVTTIDKDGKERIEEYKGKEGEDYLKELENKDGIKEKKKRIIIRRK